MFAVISSQNLFHGAHKLAKATRQNFGSYREAFAAALREGYKAIKKASAKVAEIVRAAFVKAAPKMVRTYGTVADRLLALGCKVWKGQRIYANRFASKIFANYDNFGRGRKAQLESAYFDLTAGEWRENWIGNLNPEFQA